MKNNLTLIVATLALALVCSCSNKPNNETSNENSAPSAQTQEGESIEQFNEIEVAGAMQVFFSQDKNCSLRIEAPQEMKDKIVTSVNGKSLLISTKDEMTGEDASLPMSDVKVYLTSPLIKDVEVSGSGTFTATSPIEATRFDIDLNGSGNVILNGLLSCSYLDLELKGSGDIRISESKVDKLEAEVSGSGNINFENITANSINSTISGAGNIRLKGTAKTNTQSITGAGKVDITELTVENAK